MASSVSSGPATIRVLVTDSAPMNSQMLAEALAKHAQFLVFQAESSPAAVLQAIAEHRPHVVVVSAAVVGEPQGTSLTESIRNSFPATRVVQLLDVSERESVVRAFRSGARGVFCRTGSLELLAKCITRLQQGHIWANAEELNFVMDALGSEEPRRRLISVGNVPLSRREMDVTRCVAEGLTNREIANRLGLTEHTVKNYLFRIFDKVGVSSRVELVLFALSGPSPSGGEAAADSRKPPSQSDRFEDRAGSVPRRQPSR